MGGTWSTSSETTDPAVSVETEPSGLVILHHHAPERQSACAMVSVGVGSRDEEKGEHGLAHVLEHLLFMGTRDFPGVNDISAELDRVGAQHNAFTSMDETCYHVKLIAHKLPLGLRVLAQMVLHPLLRAEVLEKEKEVVKQEILKSQDNASEHVNVMAYLQLFRDHPTLSHSIAGTTDDIDGYTRDHVVRFWRRHYRLPRMALVVCAPQPFEEVQAWARHAFAASSSEMMQLREIVSPPVALPPRPRALAHRREIRPALDQSHVCLLFPCAAGYAHRDRYALQLLALVLGGYSSSRLWRLIREKNGWAYTVYSEIYELDDVTVLEVYMAVAAEHSRAAIRAAMHEIKRVARQGVTESERQDALGHAEGARAMRMESTSGAASFWSNQLLHTHLRRPATPGEEAADTAPPTLPMRPEEEAAVLRGITPEDLRRVAREVLACRNATVVRVGPRVPSPSVNGDNSVKPAT